MLIGSVTQTVREL